MADLAIGISPESRAGVHALLGKLLADEYVLYTKTRNYHWNVTGVHFHALHKFFEEQYEAVDDSIDDIAERIRSLGGRSPASLKEFLATTRLPEQDPNVHPSAAQMIQHLLSDHEAIIRELRQDVETTQNKFGDAGTADFLTGLMEEHEKMAWMLRAHKE